MMSFRWPFFFLISSFLLVGCKANSDSIPNFIGKAHENATMTVAPLPDMPIFIADDFLMSTTRVPFLRPIPEKIADVSRNCWQPNFDREKGDLEIFPINQLVMRGVMGDSDALWALIRTPEGQLSKVRKGHYLGLNHGRVLNINPKSVVIEEILSDGMGCWLKRAKVLELQ